jgi:hypothetical protein
MARGRKPKKDGLPQVSPPSGNFKPSEFDEIDLPSDIPPSSNEEFETIDLNPANFNLPPQIDKLIAAKSELEEKLLLKVTEQAFSAQSGTDSYGFENIVGVGISEKMVNNVYTGRMCISVFVVSKESEHDVHPDAMVPKQINGIPTDVVATGEIHAFPHRGRYRPAPGGVSIGHFQVTAGTLGCLVRRGSQLFILSNNHVLANSNNANIGDPIMQPGPFDGGVSAINIIARLSEFVPIQFGNIPNQVDAAIAQTNASLVTPQSKCFGSINPTPQGANLFQVVKKCGRTTQTSRGIVSATNVTIRVGYGTSGTALFQNQIIIAGLPAIAPFSQPGDSGSLVLDNFSNRPVGLLFAGSSLITIISPIQTVLNLLNVSIIG